MQIPCEVCEKAFEAKRASAKFCGATCRKRASRQQPPSSSAAVPIPVRASAPAVESDGLVAATVEELVAAGRLNSVLGQQALHLANRIDSPRSLDTGAAVASLHKQLSATMVEALKGAARRVDPVDELEARRLLKSQGA